MLRSDRMLYNAGYALMLGFLPLLTVRVTD